MQLFGAGVQGSIRKAKWDSKFQEPRAEAGFPF